MSYKVRIKNNKTGEIRHRIMDFNWSDGSHFWWTDGNFGCDCNREWEFKRAAGESTSEEPECGYSRFTVIDATLDDGSLIIIDEREE